MNSYSWQWKSYLNFLTACAPCGDKTRHSWEVGTETFPTALARFQSPYFSSRLNMGG